MIETCSSAAEATRSQNHEVATFGLNDCGASVKHRPLFPRFGETELTKGKLRDAP